MTIIASLLTSVMSWSNPIQNQKPDFLESQSPASPLSEDSKKNVTRIKDMIAKRTAARTRKRKQQALQEARNGNHIIVPPEACEARPMNENLSYEIEAKDFPLGKGYFIEGGFKNTHMLALANGVRSAQTSIIFPYPSDQYTIKILSVAEDDGHTFQEVLLNDEVIIEHIVPITTKHWKSMGPEYHCSSDVVEIKKGDILTIRSTTPKDQKTNLTRARCQGIHVTPFVSKPRGKALPAAVSTSKTSKTDQKLPASSNPIPEKHGVVKAQRSEKHTRNSDGSYPILSTDFPLGDCLLNYKARWIGMKPGFGSVETSVYFPYATRKYKLSFTPVAENRGQVQHEIFINGVPILKTTAPKARHENYVQASKPVSTITKIKISRGDLITVKSKIVSLTASKQCYGYWESINFSR